MNNSPEYGSIEFPREADWFDAWVATDGRLVQDGPMFVNNITEFNLSDLHNVIITVENIDITDLIGQNSSFDEDESSDSDIIPERIWNGEMSLAEFIDETHVQPVKRSIEIQLDKKDDQTEHIRIVVNFRDNEPLKRMIKRHSDRFFEEYGQYEANLKQNDLTTPLVYGENPEYGQITVSPVSDEDNNKERIALVFEADFVGSDQQSDNNWNRAIYLTAVLDAFGRVYPWAQNFIDAYPV